MNGALIIKMIKLIEFKNMGFKITWKLVNIGFKSEKQFFNMLSVDEIIDYAISLLDSNNDEDLINLASSKPDEIEDINMNLTKLAQKEKVIIQLNIENGDFYMLPKICLRKMRNLQKVYLI